MYKIVLMTYMPPPPSIHRGTWKKHSRSNLIWLSTFKIFFYCFYRFLVIEGPRLSRFFEKFQNFPNFITLENGDIIRVGENITFIFQVNFQISQKLIVWLSCFHIQILFEGGRVGDGPRYYSVKIISNFYWKEYTRCITPIKSWRILCEFWYVKQRRNPTYYKRRISQLHDTLFVEAISRWTQETNNRK